MTAADLATPGAAFLAGLATSLHCAGMCGPLACAACPSTPPHGATNGLIYHGSRLLAYATVGAIAGWSGASLAAALDQPVWQLLPWAFLLLFAAIAFAWDPTRRLRAPAWLARPLGAAARLRGPRGALALGACTPLIPCGPLYLAAGVAATSGSAGHGALLMLSFGAGTVLLLELVRHHFGRWIGRTGPGLLRKLQLGIALAACLMVALRLAWPHLSPAGKACPLCP